MARLWTALLAPLLLGCAASSDAMGELGYARPNRPRPGYALVVFVRPSNYASGDLYHVFSDRYGFLGDAQPESWFGAELPAGQHIFCASGGGVPALQASLAPGRIYFVEVSARFGFWGSKVELIAVAPRFDNWAKHEQWLADNEAYVLVDRSAFEPDNVASIVGDCQKRLGDYSSDELDQRTLQPGDGI
jgi:hypothetical protein